MDKKRFTQNLKSYLKCTFFPKKYSVSFMIPVSHVLVDTYYVFTKPPKYDENKQWIKHGRKKFRVIEYFQPNEILRDRRITIRSNNLWREAKRYQAYLMSCPPPEHVNCLCSLRVPKEGRNENR